MIISVFKRYDDNGAWTHDFAFEIGLVKPDEKSMFRFDHALRVNEGNKLDVSECPKCKSLIDSTYEDHVFCPNCLFSL